MCTRAQETFGVAIPYLETALMVARSIQHLAVELGSIHSDPRT